VVGSRCLMAGKLRGDDAVPSLTGRSSLVEESLAAERFSYLGCLVCFYGIEVRYADR
jgi:hypothetical protein